LLPIPSTGKSVSIQAKTAVFRGEVGFSASLSHRLNTDMPIAVFAGVSHSGGRNTGASFAVSGVF
jgi:trimeric autotransporter adhesin